MRSKHPYCPYIPEDASKLIIGTMPPHRFCIKPQVLYEKDVNFYYGSEDNCFWELLSEVTGTELSRDNSETAVQERKTLLERLNIGITDIVETCIHFNGKSDDASLKDKSWKPLEELLENNPTIDTLIYTSTYVRSWMNRYADKGYHEWEDKKSKRAGSVIINGKRYRVIVLYSPSRNALRRVNTQKRFMQYKSVFR